MVTPMLNRLVPCLYFCAVMLASFMSAPSAKATMSDVHCSIQWETIKTTRDKAVLNSHLKNCGASKSGVAARARLAMLSKPDVPPPPPPPSRCDRLEQAARSGREGDLQTFVNSCPAHLQWRAAKERLQRATEARVQVKLNQDMSRWGLTFQDMCGLDRDILYKKALVDSRIVSIREYAAKGDSVAQLLLGYNRQNDFYKLGSNLSSVRIAFEQSASNGNPRGMAAFGSFLMTTSPAEYQKADRWFLESARLKCGVGAYWKGIRVAKESYYSKIPPPWASESPNTLYQLALDLGNGSAGCALADRNFPNDYSKREPIYNKAEKFGAPCGTLYKYVAAWEGFGPYASSKEGALKSILELANSGSYEANWAYYNLKSLDGSLDLPELLPFLKRAAEDGSTQAMVRLGRAYARNDLGLAVNRQTAIDWCFRAHQLGAEDGTACVGMLATDYIKWLDAAFKIDACAPYRVGVDFMPSYMKGMSADALLKKVSNLKITERLSVLWFLKNVTYAVSLTANSNSVCAPDAKNWSKFIETIIEPALDPGAAAARKQGK